MHKNTLNPTAMTQTVSEPSEGYQLPPVDLSSFEQLVIVAIAVLEQALDLVADLQDDSQLSFNSTLIPGSTIGKLLVLLVSND